MKQPHHLPGGVAPGERREEMKAKDVLEVWTGWDSSDIFEIRETTPKRKIIFRHYMCGAEIISHFGERELKRFGSFGKQADGTWKHYIEIVAD